MIEEVAYSIEPSGDVRGERRRYRWLHRWPVLIPLLLVGGLLWISLWYSRRAQLLEDASHVEFEAPTWTWLEAFTGPEVRTLIGSPTALHLSDGQTTKANLRLVAGFGEMTDFAAPDMTDADLEYLTGCTKLRSLNLQPSSITDAGIQSLGRFGDLERLWLATDQPLSSASLDALAPLGRLRILGIDTPSMKQVDLAPLSDLRNLESLTLTGAEIGGDSLKHLAGLPRLQGLGLRDCRIDVDALAALQRSASQPRLILNGSSVTDRHLPALEKLTWLLTVSFHGTQVSDEACLRLKQERPGMEIYDAQGHRVLLSEAVSADQLEK
jgi:hypothetical protein